MERVNTELYREVQENVAVQDQADAKTAEIFAFLDEVSAHFAFRISPPPPFPLVRSLPWVMCHLLLDTDALWWPHGCSLPLQIYAKWKELPLEDIQAWTLLTAETQSAVNPTP
jgi:hypothetical protein